MAMPISVIHRVRMAFLLGEACGCRWSNYATGAIRRPRDGLPVIPDADAHAGNASLAWRRDSAPAGMRRTRYFGIANRVGDRGLVRLRTGCETHDGGGRD